MPINVLAAKMLAAAPAGCTDEAIANRIPMSRLAFLADPERGMSANRKTLRAGFACESVRLRGR